MAYRQKPTLQLGCRFFVEGRGSGITYRGSSVTYRGSRVTYRGSRVELIKVNIKNNSNIK